MLAALVPLCAWGDHPYFTTYQHQHHLEPGGVEVMIMTDFTAPSAPKRDEDGQKEYFSQMLELEYYASPQWAFEFMAEGFQDVGTGDAAYTGQRYEARYRVFEDDVPLNPVLYAEYEDLDPRTRYKMEVSGWVEPPYDDTGGAEPDRERILETRMILSQNVGPWNAAFNWINETDLNAGETAFGYALGLSRDLGHGGASCRDHADPAATPSEGSGHGEHAVAGHEDHAGFRPAALAFELVGALGDTRKFGLRPGRQEHYFQPSLMFHTGESSMLAVGFGIGLSDDSDHLIRLAYGWTF